MRIRHRSTTNPFRPPKRHLAAFFLFFFLFSANTLFFSTHFVEELGYNRPVVSNHTASNPHQDSSASTANHHQGEERSSHHGDTESCCDSHSHASILYQQVSFNHIPHLTSNRQSDPFKFIPEVYLDRFIPPAELA